MLHLYRCICDRSAISSTVIVTCDIGNFVLSALRMMPKSSYQMRQASVRLPRQRFVDKTTLAGNINTAASQGIDSNIVLPLLPQYCNRICKP
jgi:hypothetical protein